MAGRCLGSWAWACLGPGLGGAGFNPQRYVPAPTSATVRIAPAKSLLHCRPKRISASTAGHGHQGGPSPELGRTTPVHHRGPPSVTPWKTQCAQSIRATAECPSMECQGIDQVWHWSCAGLGAHSGQPGGCVPTGPTELATNEVASPLGFSLALWLHPSIANDGTVRGERYGSARGEILRSLPDPLQRRRSASVRSSIKNESSGSKDDQTPS